MLDDLWIDRIWEFDCRHGSVVFELKTFRMGRLVF